MTIGSSTLPGVRARVLPRFPANVIAGTGISIVKTGATYSISLTSDPLGLASLFNCANDGAAASSGVPVGGLYRNGSVLMVRVV
jgi:hypothetical protein